MSLRNFTNEIHSRQLSMEARGFKLAAIYVSPEGEKVILAGSMREPCPDLAVVPDLRIHDVPIKTHLKMPTAHVWYVFNGGLAA